MKAILLILAVMAVAPAWAAEHDHGAHSAPGTPMVAPDDPGTMAAEFMATKEIDGYTVTFHVMASADDMKSMGADSLMVKIEKEGAVVRPAAANSKVIFPDGAEISHPMMAMGDWLMSGYDLAKEGEHQVMVLFKTADGKKHFGGVRYP